jgi:hypothetical protein
MRQGQQEQRRNGQTIPNVSHGGAMTAPKTSSDRLDVAAILAVAVAKVELLDETLTWRRQAPSSPGRQRQLDALLRQRGAIVATLDSLRLSLIDPMTSASLVAGLPSPRPEVGIGRLANPWWATA